MNGLEKIKNTGPFFVFPFVHFLIVEIADFFAQFTTQRNRLGMYLTP